MNKVTAVEWMWIIGLAIVGAIALPSMFLITQGFPTSFWSLWTVIVGGNCGAGAGVIVCLKRRTLL